MAHSSLERYHLKTKTELQLSDRKHGSTPTASLDQSQRCKHLFALITYRHGSTFTECIIIFQEPRENPSPWPPSTNPPTAVDYKRNLLVKSHLCCCSGSQLGRRLGKECLQDNNVQVDRAHWEGMLASHVELHQWLLLHNSTQLNTDLPRESREGNEMVTGKDGSISLKPQK